MEQVKCKESLNLKIDIDPGLHIAVPVPFQCGRSQSPQAPLVTVTSSGCHRLLFSPSPPSRHERRREVAPSSSTSPQRPHRLRQQQSMASEQQPSSRTSPTSGLMPLLFRIDPPTGAHAFSMHAHMRAPQIGAVHRVNLPLGLITCQPRQHRHAFQVPDGSVSLETLGQTPYLLFCVSMHDPARIGSWVWHAGMAISSGYFWTCLVLHSS